MIESPFRDDDPRDDEVRAMFEQGWESLVRKQLSLAQEQLETALVLSQRLENDDLDGICIALGKTMLDQKRFRQAIPYLERARNLYRAKESAEGEGWALTLLAECEWKMHHRKLARKLVVQALWILRHEKPGYLRLAVQEAGRQSWLSRRWRQAECLYRHSARLCRIEELADGELYSHCSAAFLALKRSRIRAARSYLDSAIEIAERASPEQRYKWILEECRWIRRTESVSAVAEFLDRQDVTMFPPKELANIAICRAWFATPRLLFFSAMRDAIRAVCYSIQ